MQGGEFLSLLPAKHKYGVDISPAFVKKAREKNIIAHVVDVETEKLPYPNNYFDLATCMELLEHLFDPGGLLSGIKRVLKRGGYVYATVPNDLYCLPNRLRVFLGRPFIEDPHHAHIRFFHKTVLRRLFEETGFKVIYLGGFSRKPFPTAIEKFLSKHFTGIFVSNYSIIAKKV